MTRLTGLSDRLPPLVSRLWRWRPRPGDVLLLAILAVAAYLRLSHLEMAQFRGDDAGVWEMVDYAFRQGVLPREGPITSVGVPSGPLMVYMLLPLRLLSDSVALGTAFLSALAVLGVWVCYRLARENFGERAALVAAGLFAINPWSVVFVRRLWPNGPLPVFTVLLFWSLFRFLFRGRTIHLVLSFVWLAFLVQLHVSGYAHILTVGLVLLFAWRRLRPLPMAAGLASFLAIMGPYLASGVLPRLPQVLKVANQGGVGQAPRVDGQSLYSALLILSSDGYQAMAAQIGNLLDATGTFVRSVDSVVYLLLLVGVGESLFAVAASLFTRRPGDDRGHRLAVLLAWAFLPVLILVRHSLDVSPHYMLVAQPALFILVGVGADRLMGSRSGGGVHLWVRRIATTGGLATLAVLQLVLSGFFFQGADQYWPENDYGLPLHYNVEIARAVRELSQGKAGEKGMVLVGGHDDVARALFAAIGFERLPAPARYFDDRYALVYREGPEKLIYLTTSSPAESPFSAFLQARFLEDKVLERVIPGSRRTFSFYAISSEAMRAAVEAEAPSPLSLALDNGVRLEGYGLPERVLASEGVTVTLRWGVDRKVPAPVQDYRLFTHLVDGQGRRFGQVDSLAYSQQFWGVGDAVLQWLHVAVSPEASLGSYWASVGMYGLPDIQRVPMRGGNGQSADTSTLLGPLVVEDAKASPRPAHKAGANFAGRLGLVGYTLDPASARLRPGEPLKVALFWRPGERLDRDYTVFVHLADGEGKPLVQKDGQPRQGSYPTSLWKSGETVVDDYELHLPPTLPPGRYRLLVGLYYLPTLQRLRLVGEGTGRDYLDLAEITVD